MKNWQDPNAAVEAANYDNPIPSRVLILQTLLERGQAYPTRACDDFDLDDDDEYDALGNPFKSHAAGWTIKPWCDGGNPYIYRPLTENDAVTGVVAAHAKGFGFVVLDDMPDLFWMKLKCAGYFMAIK